MILAIGLVFATGASLGDFELLQPAVYVLAALSVITVVQRIWHVRRELSCDLALGVTLARAGGSSLPEHGTFRNRTLRPARNALGSSTNGHAASTARASTNGAARYQSEKVRVAIIGVGNCASAFVQGVHYYRDADPAQRVPGLMHVDLGGYHVRDIEFTAAFDIDATKVGKDLGQAIWAGQNNTIKFAKAPRGPQEARRARAPRHDPRRPRQVPQREDHQGARARPPTSCEILKDTHTDVVVSYLPVGSEQATKWYVEQVLEAGCGFVNCIPVFIAREDYWDKRFKEAGLPIVGDDIKSQVGATIVHRTLARLFAERGVEIERTSQLNVGGNMDFYNMLERERLESKKISKTNAVTSIMDHELPRERRPRRALGLRAVADRPQVGAHPRRGPGVRRRAAERRAEARGVGLAELGGHRDRRGALLQAGAQPRRRRAARRAVLLPDEVAAQPAPRRPGARGHREVHRQVRTGAAGAEPCRTARTAKPRKVRAAHAR